MKVGTGPNRILEREEVKKRCWQNIKKSRTKDGGGGFSFKANWRENPYSPNIQQTGLDEAEKNVWAMGMYFIWR